MALGTLFGQGGSISLEFGATQHNTNIAGLREIQESSGGQTFTTADGVTHKTPAVRTTVAVEVIMYQDLTAANLWRYLRETTPTTGTLTVNPTTSTTESSTNPALGYVVTGWEQPGLDWDAQGTAKTVSAIIYVSGNATIDTTP